MATKSVKPRIRVEEVIDEKPVTSEVKEVKNTTPAKISSFAQLDSDKTTVPVREDAKITPEPTKEVVMPEETKSEVTEPNIPETTTEEVSEKMSSDDVKQWLKDIRPDTTKEVEKSGNGFNFKMFFLFLLIFAAVGALIGGLVYYKQKVGGVTMRGTETPTPEATNTPAPTETPAVAVDLSKLTVNILNGSGIKGEASKVESLLAKAGFTADKIDTGNANTYDYKTTSVSLKKNLSDEVFEKVKAALGSGYDVVKGVGTVKDSSPFDVEIIVGKKS